MNRLKKSILQIGQMDTFIFVAVLALIAGSFYFNRVSRAEPEASQVYLYLSMHNEELFDREIISNLLQEFNKKNPDTTIQLFDRASSPSNRGSSSLPAFPDILIFDGSEFCSLVADGALALLFPADNFSGGETDSFNNPFQFAVPLVSFMDLLFFNIEILTNAGFSHPPRSREDFLAYARAVQQRARAAGAAGISGTAFSLNTDDRLALSRDLFSWIWAAGGNFWPDETQEPFVQTPPTFNTRAMINDITFFRTLYNEGLLAPNVFETTGNQRLEEFAQGQIAMMIASTRIIPMLRERMGDGEFGITTIPRPATGGRYNISVTSIYAGISANSMIFEDETSSQAALRKEAAMAFIEFLAEQSSKLSEELKAVPGSLFSHIPENYIRADTFYSKAWSIFEASQIVHGFIGRSNAKEYENIFLEELKNFFDGTRTAQQTVVSIYQRWNEAADLTYQ